MSRPAHTSAATRYRFTHRTVEALTDVMTRRGYPRATVLRALDELRFIPDLRSPDALDWRAPILFGARRSGVAGIALGLKVFVVSPRHLRSPALLAHEAMHVVQQQHRKMLPFLTRYSWHWLKRRASGMDHDTAYRSLPDEEEARDIERDAVRALAAHAPWIIEA